MSEDQTKITSEDQPKITTVKKEKDPKRVEAGKKLAAISEAGKNAWEDRSRKQAKTRR